ncbi:FAD-dependent oxidoreductase [Paenibacillus sp. FSL W8-0186]|uniref:NAD(P)/FAD-dependent oxidoreductase n=1 Tax=Paenibacillus sp. FSL W8-0186 TaxID=2921709 RepID=UPI0030D156FC
MNELICLVVGGGYAGINAIQSIRQAFQKAGETRKIRIVLIDKEPYHLRKVLLFKPAAHQEEITIPFTRMFSDIQVIRGTVGRIEHDQKQARYRDGEGKEHTLAYDIAVVTVGSIVRRPKPDQGGIALTELKAAAAIRQQWQENMRQAAEATDPVEKQRLLTTVVAGAGISGIENSAELAWFMRQEAGALEIDPEMIKVYLINAQARLFPEGPLKVGRRLEHKLHNYGVTVLHEVKALQEKEGMVSLSSGEVIPAGLCVWTLGLLPNPALREMGLPLTADGQVIVDASYRVQGMPGMYSIGDCARIVDPATGRADTMTCKEGGAQASRLGAIVLADLNGRPAPQHKGYMDAYCFGLGGERGMVWTRQWGLDMIITGRLGWKIRQYTWDIASLLKQPHRKP